MGVEDLIPIEDIPEVRLDVLVLLDRDADVGAAHVTTLHLLDLVDGVGSVLEELYDVGRVRHLHLGSRGVLYSHARR